MKFRHNMRDIHGMPILCNCFSWLMGLPLGRDCTGARQGKTWERSGLARLNRCGRRRCRCSVAAHGGARAIVAKVTRFSTLALGWSVIREQIAG
jgi:hypothetical protein